VRAATRTGGRGWAAVDEDDLGVDLLTDDEPTSTAAPELRAHVSVDARVTFYCL
jgi:hypothetical protein